MLAILVTAQMAQNDKAILRVENKGARNALVNGLAGKAVVSQMAATLWKLTDRASFTV